MKFQIKGDKALGKRDKKIIMDITEFINSRDIAEHLRKTDYRFSPEEAMFLIHEARNVPLAEKHAAYEELIGIYPDHKLKERREGVFKNHTLASFLREYMQKENALVATCKKDGEDAIYYSSYYSKDESEGWVLAELYDSIYHTFRECFDATIEDSGEFLNKLSVTKKYIKTNETIELELFPDGTVLNVKNSDWCDSILSAFEWMWIKIPTPFKRGDILVPHKERVFDHHVHEEGEDAFVLTDMCTWGSKELAENGYINAKTYKANEKDFEHADKMIRYNEESGDPTDMIVTGFFVSSDGTVYHNHTEGDTYLDYEYYRGDLTGENRMLKAVSNYVKGEVPLELLMQTYQITLLEKNLGSMQRCTLNVYDEDYLNLVGLVPSSKS